MSEDSEKSKQAAKIVPSKDDEADDADAKAVKAKAGVASESESESEGEGDAFRPEDIVKRIDALGDENEADKIARQEEDKLAERKRALKKKDKKTGIEAAAARKVSKVGTKKSEARRAAPAVAFEADPLLERTAKLSKWARENSRVVGIVAAVAVLGGAAFAGVSYLQKRKEIKASSALSIAVADERGRIADVSKEDADKVQDPRPAFATHDARRDKALAEYRDVATQYTGTGAAILARLGEGSILLDKREADAAANAFSDVKSSPLALVDGEVKGRALEGLGFAYELKAQLEPGEKAKHLDAAIAQFKELENTGTKGFKELGQYHQARCQEAKDNKPEATKILGDLYKALSADGKSYPFLLSVVEDRLRALDPAAIPPKPKGGPNGGLDMNDPKIRELLQKIKSGQGGGDPHGHGQ